MKRLWCIVFGHRWKHRGWGTATAAGDRLRTARLEECARCRGSRYVFRP